MEIIKPGTGAKTKISNIEGFITGVNIRHGGTRYEFSYFSAGKYESVWLDEFEFDTTSAQKQKIGFKSQ